MNKNFDSGARKLDFSKLTFDEMPMKSSEALADVVPFNWPGSVVKGEAKIMMKYNGNRERRE